MRKRMIGAAAVLIFLVAVTGARAALTVTPTTLQDLSSSGTGSCPTDPCSLRQAVNYVHSQGSGTVSLAPPAPQGEYDLTQGSFPTLVVLGGVSLVGPGPGVVTIKLAAGQGQVIEHTAPSGGPDVISGVTITGGKGGIGGGLLNQGALTLDDVHITGNTSIQGGGLDTETGLTMSNSTVDHNTAVNNGNPESGGGIATENANGQVTISNTTIAENTAGRGGGLFDRGIAAVTLENVTIADNHATLGASGAGGNIYLTTPTPLQADNTIIAGGTASTAGTENCVVPMGASVTGTHTLDEGGQCGLTGAGDINANPQLGQLQDNGGTTSTLALGIGSPAINAGSNCLDAASMPLIRDQRGITRPQGPSCDLGAFEFRMPVLAGSPQIVGTLAVGQTLTCSPPTVTSPDGAPNLTFQWLRDGTPIGGATGQSYTVVTSDATHTLACQVTATYGATAAQGSVQATSAGMTVPSPPPPPPVKITPAGAPSATIVNGTVVVASGEAVSCPTGGAPCIVKVTVTVRTKKKHKPVTIARASVTVAPGATASLKFKLTKAGARLLARLRTLKAKLTITVTHGNDRPVSTTRTVVLHSPKRHHLIERPATLY